MALVIWDDDPACLVDADSDWVPDLIDNCSAAANTSQFDWDFDGFGNQCDCDYENNNACDGGDYGILGEYFGQRVPPAPAYIDQNGNFSIDGGDFGAFAGGFGQPPGPSCENPKETPCP